MMTTRLYKNNGKEEMNVVELATSIPAGGQVSLTSEGHAHVNPVNYPGLEVVDESIHAEGNAPSDQAPASDHVPYAATKKAAEEAINSEEPTSTEDSENE